MDQKKHYLNLHDIRFKDPNVVPNRQLAFSIPLFESHYYGKKYDQYFDLYNDVFTKPALWSAMSFLWNSDLGENGIKFYFHIEPSVYDRVSSYLWANGVPDEYIRKIELPDNFEYNEDVAHTQFGKKFLCFYDDDVDVDAWNIIDSDVFLCGSGQSGLYRELTSALLRGSISVHEFNWVRYNYCFYMKRVFYAAGLTTGELDATGWINEGFDLWKSKNMLKPNKIEQLCFSRYKLDYKFNENVAASDYVVRPFVSANLLQIPRDHDFVHFFKEHGHQCYHEEGLLGIYFMAKNIVPIRLDQVTGIPRYLWAEEYKPGQDTYLAHYLDSEQKFGTEAYSDFYLSMLRMYRNIYERSADEVHFEKVEPSEKRGTYFEIGAGWPQGGFLLDEDWQRNYGDVLTPETVKVLSDFSAFDGYFVEAVPEQVESLHETFKHRENATVINAAISGSPGMQALHVFSSGMGVLQEYSLGQSAFVKSFSVNCMDLDTLFANVGETPDLLRVDIEGAEVSTLEAYSFDPKPRVIIVDTHLRNKERVTAILEGQGYVVLQHPEAVEDVIGIFDDS